MTANERAIVAGGGGLGGIAWEVGYLAGLHERGFDLESIDCIIGTSAGAVVAAQVCSGLPIAELYRRQVDPAAQPLERYAPFDRDALIESFRRRRMDPIGYARESGSRALRARTISEDERRRIIEGRLPSHEWPASRLLITAVDAETGDPRTFDAASGVALVDAVAASTALPGVWPPCTIHGRKYIDGGVRSMENADLAAGAACVLVMQAMPLPGVDTLADELAVLARDGTRHHVASPDAAVLAAMGANPLDPAIRSATAAASRHQGMRDAPEVLRFWNQ